MEIRDTEKRRAQNLIWNAAGDYHFQPVFRAYDELGRADLYWNSIIGAVRKNYGPDAFAPLFESFHGYMDEQLYEQVVWIGLENAVYQREAPHRPALPALRTAYAKHVISLHAANPNDRLLDVLLECHYRRALGEIPEMKPRDKEILDALEFSGDLDAQTLAKQATDILMTYFDFIPGQHSQQAAASQALRRHHIFSFRRRKPLNLPAVRGFGYGFGEHISPSGGGGADTAPPKRRITDLNAAQSEAAIQKYIHSFFGAPLYDEHKTAALEQDLCVDEHKGCHLYYANGDAQLDPDLRGYAGAQRKAALKQMEKNETAYEADLTRHRATIVRLTARIRNAMMAYLQPTVVRSASGTLDAGRIWRGLYLNDDKVFTRVLQSDPGDLCVDLLLDGSTSQLNRQEIVAAQGYMIAESLTRCNIPVRVTSFCSLSGYTILTRFRDYQEKDQNRRIFHYFTTGCNRDGLAIRALGKELEDAPCEHRLVILLSDAKPNDVIKMARDQSYVDYAEQEGIQNTAHEVRALLRQEISVICVFTGDDEDIPAAHTIYGRNFARIRSLDQFADTVGTLIQNQIRAL